VNGIHEDDYSAIGTQHEQVTGRIKDLLIELQNHAYATGVERGKELAKQAAIEAGTISPTLCQTIHLGQPGVTVEPCLMLGPDEEEAACLLFTAPGTEVRLTWPTQTQALAVLAAATAEACTEADAPPVTCECGDSYPLSSHGAGFIEGRGHCANCAAGAGEMASLLGVSPAPDERVEREVQQSEPVAIWDDMTKLARATSNRRIKHGAPLYATPQPAAPAAQDVAGLVEALGRALDFIRGDGDFEHREALERCECYACVTGEIIDSLAAHQSGG
tara:strand:+ start:22 stop:846 length:825 start_codon:yes stop_codon:yes gene_type:complete